MPAAHFFVNAAIKRAVDQFERSRRRNMIRAARAAPKHIPTAINRTTSIARKVSKLGLLAALEKAMIPMKTRNTGQEYREQSYADQSYP